MFIIASIAVLFLVSVCTVEGQGTTPACVDNTFICSSCTTLDACFFGTRYPITCTTGQVCGNDGKSETIDKCFDAGDSANTKLSQCSCDPFATSPSYMADGLSDDPKAYIACLPGDAAPQSLSCTTGDEVFLEGQIPPCGEAPPTTTPGPTTSTTTPTPFTCTEAGFATDPNDCSKYWLCTAADDDNPIEQNCANGLVFNDATLSCFDPCDDSAQTFSCNGASGGVPDSLDCSVFHICVNGAAIGQPVPCTGGDGFNPETMKCETGFTCTEKPCLKCPDSETTAVIE